MNKKQLAMREENPKIKTVQLGHYLRTLMDDSQLSFAAYQALRIKITEELIFLQGCANELTTAQQIFLGMVAGIHANLKGIMPDITKLVHRCISLLDHKFKKDK
jgi:hypothetical protein